MLSKLLTLFGGLFGKLRLKPLSLAGKCRFQFGGAVVFILTVALLIPYFWMVKLTEKASLDASRALANMVYERHFQINSFTTTSLAMLEESGAARSEKTSTVQWLPLLNADPNKAAKLTEAQVEAIKFLKTQEQNYDYSWREKQSGSFENNYIRIVRATDHCIACHNPQGPAVTYNRNEIVGAIVIKTPTKEFTKTILMNRIWIIAAGLLSLAGAVVAFYMIAQQMILSPVRQLRALVNNVTEGNLGARSSLKTDDEFEKLSNAFNAMLDSLQESQEKLRQANKQLDQKIVELSDRNIELFKANKLKSEFLANISHEFRTPLNAILGFADIIKDKAGQDNDKTRRYAENIVTSGKSLLGMINDLLELAKAEAGKITLHINKTNIQELCQDLAAFFSPLTEKKMIKVRVDVDDTIPIIETDTGKVQQILYNLLSNAIKFTPEYGRIGIIAKLVEAEKAVCIAVSDTGCGISAEDQEKIFEKFRQVDGSLTRVGGGTGLGLAICKELSDILGGKVRLESEVGKGSTFYLQIPLVLTEDQK